MTMTKSGFVAIIGRPNVGKSTLLNSLLGEKISIISPKPQTTRWQILGIKTLKQAQIIYVDTPGIHSEEKRAMNRYMNRVANAVILDADASTWNGEDELVLKKLQEANKPIILAINKIDLLKDKTDILLLIDKLKNKMNFAHIIPISAIEGDNVLLLEEEIIQLLPEGPQLFPEDQITDKNIRFQMAEIIREKIIQSTEEELPYTTTVEIEQFQEMPTTKPEQKKVIEVGAIIWVERPGQKIIIIGKKGLKLKRIGMEARREIEKLVGSKVFLRLWVKIKEHWTDDDKALKSLGYE